MGRISNTGYLDATASSSSSVALADDLAALRAATDLVAPDIVLLRTLVSWTQLFGLLSFELFGQTHGLIEHHDALFEAAAGTMATSIGLS